MVKQSQELQERIAALQAKRDVLEQEALAHEQAARDKRAERNQIKADLAELGSVLQGAQIVAAAQASANSAEQAAQLARERAESLAKLQEETKRLNEELGRRIDELESED